MTLVMDMPSRDSDSFWGWLGKCVGDDPLNKPKPIVRQGILGIHEIVMEQGFKPSHTAVWDMINPNVSYTEHKLSLIDALVKMLHRFGSIKDPVDIWISAGYHGATLLESMPAFKVQEGENFLDPPKVTGTIGEVQVILDKRIPLDAINVHYGTLTYGRIIAA